MSKSNDSETELSFVLFNRPPMKTGYKNWLYIHIRCMWGRSVEDFRVTFQNNQIFSSHSSKSRFIILKLNWNVWLNVQGKKEKMDPTRYYDAVIIRLNLLAGIQLQLKLFFYMELILQSLCGSIFIYTVDICSTWRGNCEKEALFPLQDTSEMYVCKLG